MSKKDQDYAEKVGELFRAGLIDDPKEYLDWQDAPEAVKGARSIQHDQIGHTREAACREAKHRLPEVNHPPEAFETLAQEYRIVLVLQEEQHAPPGIYERGWVVWNPSGEKRPERSVPPDNVLSSYEITTHTS
jgi:hypothetical protein